MYAGPFSLKSVSGEKAKIIQVAIGREFVVPHTDVSYFVDSRKNIYLKVKNKELQKILKPFKVITLPSSAKLTKPQELSALVRQEQAEPIRKAPPPAPPPPAPKKEPDKPVPATTYTTTEVSAKEKEVLIPQAGMLMEAWEFITTFKQKNDSYEDSPVTVCLINGVFTLEMMEASHVEAVLVMVGGDESSSLNDEIFNPLGIANDSLVYLLDDLKRLQPGKPVTIRRDGNALIIRQGNSRLQIPGTDHYTFLINASRLDEFRNKAPTKLTVGSNVFINTIRRIEREIFLYYDPKITDGLVLMRKTGGYGADAFLVMPVLESESTGQALFGISFGYEIARSLSLINSVSVDKRLKLYMTTNKPIIIETLTNFGKIILVRSPYVPTDERGLLKSGEEAVLEIGREVAEYYATLRKLGSPTSRGENTFTVNAKLLGAILSFVGDRPLFMKRDGFTEIYDGLFQRTVVKTAAFRIPDSFVLGHEAEEVTNLIGSSDDLILSVNLESKKLIISKPSQVLTFNIYAPASFQLPDMDFDTLIEKVREASNAVIRLSPQTVKELIKILDDARKDGSREISFATRKNYVEILGEERAIGKIETGVDVKKEEKHHFSPKSLIEMLRSALKLSDKPTIIEIYLLEIRGWSNFAIHIADNELHALGLYDHAAI